jgi:hypothetical protein
MYVYNVTLRRVHESLLLWKSNKYYIFVGVRVHVFTKILLHKTLIRPVVI